MTMIVITAAVGAGFRTAWQAGKPQLTSLHCIFSSLRVIINASSIIPSVWWAVRARFGTRSGVVGGVQTFGQWLEPNLTRTNTKWPYETERHWRSACR